MELIKVIPKIMHAEKDFRCQIFWIFSVFAKQNKAILLYLIQAASNVFYQHWDMS